MDVPLFVQMLLLKDKCDSLGIEFYVFDGICDINLHCLSKIKDDREKYILSLSNSKINKAVGQTCF